MFYDYEESLQYKKRILLVDGGSGGVYPSGSFPADYFVKHST